MPCVFQIMVKLGASTQQCRFPPSGDCHHWAAIHLVAPYPKERERFTIVREFFKVYWTNPYVLSIIYLTEYLMCLGFYCHIFIQFPFYCIIFFSCWHIILSLHILLIHLLVLIVATCDFLSVVNFPGPYYICINIDRSLL